MTDINKYCKQVRTSSIKCHGAYSKLKVIGALPNPGWCLFKKQHF